MTRDAGSKPPHAADEQVAAALLSEQLKIHLVSLPWSIGGSVTAAVLFAAMMWSVVPRTLLAGWLACMLALIALRLGAAWFHRRAAPSPGTDRAWVLSSCGAWPACCRWPLGIRRTRRWR
jgi:hypothetical protein